MSSTILPAFTTERQRAAIGFVALTHFTLELAHNFLPVVFPLLIAQQGLSYGRLGALPLMAGVFGALAQPLFGALSDRADARAIVIASLLWGGVLMAGVGLMPGYWPLLLLVAVGSLGSAAYHPAGASLTRALPPALRSRGVALFSVAGNLGSAASPLLIGAALAWGGLRGTTLLLPVTLALALLLAIGLRATLRPTAVRGAPGARVAARARGPLAPMLLLVAAVATRSWLYGGVIAYLPTWLVARGLGAAAGARWLALLIVAVGAGGLLAGALGDRIGRTRLVFGCLLLSTPLLLLVLRAPAAGGGLGVPAAGALLALGVVIGMTFPLAILMAQDAWPHAVGLASSLVMGIGWLPAGIGAWVVGVLADRSDLTTALQSLALLPLLGCVLLGLATRRAQAAATAADYD